MFLLHQENPRIINGIGRFDFTAYDLQKRIPSTVWDMVICSAEIMQEQNDVPFEPRNVVLYPSSPRFYEVKKVYDNRHRIAVGGIQVECASTLDKTGSELFNANSILHAGYLIDAFSPYDRNLHVVSGDTIGEIAARLMIVLANIGVIE